jgi:hypothetical protein
MNITSLKKEFENKFSESFIERFDRVLDATNGPIEINNITYKASEILKTIDFKKYYKDAEEFSDELMSYGG